MSVPISPAVRPSGPALAEPQIALQADSFDARWAAWLERGRQNDLAAKRMLRIALLGAAVIGVVVALFLRLP